MRSRAPNRGEKDRWKSTSLVLHRQQLEEQQAKPDYSCQSLPHPRRYKVDGDPCVSPVKPCLGAAARKVAKAKAKRPRSLPPGVKVGSFVLLSVVCCCVDIAAGHGFLVVV